MTDITLDPITSGYNLSKLNANFDKVQQAVNEELLHTTGGNNTMLQPLDMNGYAILNLETDPDNPGSLLTVAEADERYYNVSGDTLEGPMVVGEHAITGLREAQTPTEPIRKNEFDEEVSARVSGDASLQAQINGTTPPMGSAFSVISWHGQHVTNSIDIPDNVNAWSFGPVVTIDVGQVVTIGDGSFWTIANGEVQP